MLTARKIVNEVRFIIGEAPISFFSARSSSHASRNFLMCCRPWESVHAYNSRYLQLHGTCQFSVPRSARHKYIRFQAVANQQRTRLVTSQSPAATQTPHA